MKAGLFQHCILPQTLTPKLENGCSQKWLFLVWVRRMPSRKSYWQSPRNSSRPRHDVDACCLYFRWHHPILKSSQPCCTREHRVWWSSFSEQNRVFLLILNSYLKDNPFILTKVWLSRMGSTTFESLWSFQLNLLNPFRRIQWILWGIQLICWIQSYIPLFHECEARWVYPIFTEDTQ